MRKVAPETPLRARARAIVEKGFDVARESNARAAVEPAGHRRDPLLSVRMVDPISAWLLEALNDVDNKAAEQAVVLLVVRRLRGLLNDDVVLPGGLPDEGKVGAAANMLEALVGHMGLMLQDNEVEAGTLAELRTEVEAVTLSTSPGTVIDLNRTDEGIINAMVVRNERDGNLEMFVLCSESDAKRVYRNILGTKNEIGHARRVGRDLGFYVVGDELRLGPDIAIGAPRDAYAIYRLGNLFLTVGARPSSP